MDNQHNCVAGVVEHDRVEVKRVVDGPGGLACEGAGGGLAEGQELAQPRKHHLFVQDRVSLRSLHICSEGHVT